jgi:hypothetical protein
MRISTFISYLLVFFPILVNAQDYGITTLVSLNVYHQENWSELEWQSPKSAHTHSLSPPLHLPLPLWYMALVCI